jgi:hypothetical protein
VFVHIGANNRDEKHAPPTTALGPEMTGKRRTTFGLRRDQLEKLFVIATKDQASVAPEYVEEDLAEMLHRQLAEIMPGKSMLFPAASERSENEPSDVISLIGRSLQEILFSPESSVKQLQTIKEISKRLTTTAIFEAERAVATTIYHAAIATCLVHHDRKISNHPYDRLDESFALLIDKKWMANELIELFSQARSICQSKRSKK